MENGERDVSFSDDGLVTRFDLHEVYGGDEPYTLRYQIEGQDDDGSWVRLGRPQALEQ